MTRCTLLVPALLAPTLLAAQQPVVPATLPLADALALARDYSPAYRQARNDRGPAGLAARGAYTSLFLPSVTLGGGAAYTGVGEQRFLTSSFSQSASTLSSFYSLSLSYLLSSQTLTAPGAQRAEQHAVDADVDAARRRLEFDVTNQYLAVLQATENERVARRQAENNREFLRLAQARQQVGQATLIDVRRAEVALGSAEVLLLRAEAAIEAEKLRLFERMGVQAPADRTVQLTDTFAVREPTFVLGDLLTLAEQQNPALRALRARERAAGWGVKAAWGTYAPTVSLSASWTGFTQEITDIEPLIREQQTGFAAAYNDCVANNAIRAGANPPLAPLDCSVYVWGVEQETALRQANSQFPLDFTRQPFQARLDISLPIFNNFAREQRLSQARALADDLSEAARAQGLAVVTGVSEAFLSLRTAYRAVQIQEQNRRASEEQLQLATERYRVGSGTFFELLDAQLADLRSQLDQVTAVYDYHRALALLEAAVGRSLR